jgi:hypothetical protein
MGWRGKWGGKIKRKVTMTNLTRLYHQWVSEFLAHPLKLAENTPKVDLFKALYFDIIIL